MATAAASRWHLICLHNICSSSLAVAVQVKLVKLYSWDCLLHVFRVI